MLTTFIFDPMPVSKNGEIVIQQWDNHSLIQQWESETYAAKMWTEVRTQTIRDSCIHVLWLLWWKWYAREYCAYIMSWAPLQLKFS